MAKIWLLKWGVDESYTYKLRILTCLCKASDVWSQGRGKKVVWMMSQHPGYSSLHATAFHSVTPRSPKLEI